MRREDIQNRAVGFDYFVQDGHGGTMVPPRLVHKNEAPRLMEQNRQNPVGGNLPPGCSAGEVEEIFHRSRGPGGQNVNKVETGVTLRHRPTGLSVTVEETRSRARNRALAWERLAERILAAREQRKRDRLAEEARRRRRQARRSAATKREQVASKRRRSEVKKWRSRPHHE
jgi:hypothetical protein